MSRVVLACLLAACGGSAAVDAAPPDAWPCVPAADVPELDLLFVIENSTIDISQVQVLLDGVGDFQFLADDQGRVPDLHIGVITADLGAHDAIEGCDTIGDGGRLQGTRGEAAPIGCPLPGEPFIRHELDDLGNRVTNYSGSLGEVFRCIGSLGISGCGFDQPLESLHRALDGTVLENAGFRRPGAYLAVVFWLEEDDCSAGDRVLYDPAATDLGDLGTRCVLHDIWCGEPPAPLPASSGLYDRCIPAPEPQYLHPVSRYADLLDDLQPDRGRVALAAWAFDRAPLRISELPDAGGLVVNDPCSGEWTAAGASIRLHVLMDQFPHRSFRSQCRRCIDGCPPPAEVVAGFTASVREMLYCE